MRKYLKDRRIKLGLTQKQVAKNINCSQQNYCFIENGSRQKNMDLTIMTGLAKVFNVPVEVIISEEQQMKQTTEPLTIL